LSPAKTVPQGSHLQRFQRWFDWRQHCCSHVAGGLDIKPGWWVHFFRKVLFTP
jgi:hypothetical protein